MAETWDDLEALRTSREDLFALALKLRAVGLKASPAQLVEAHDALLGLRLAGALPDDPLQWAGYLAPIFCRSAVEQDIFHRAFPDWAKSQGNFLESSPPVEKGGQDGFNTDTASANTGTPPLNVVDESPHNLIHRLASFCRQGKKQAQRRLTPLLHRREPVKRISTLALGLLVLCMVWLAVMHFLPSEKSKIITFELSEEGRTATQRKIKPLPKPGKIPTSFPSRPPEPDSPPQLPFGPYGFTSQQLAYWAAGTPLTVFAVWLVWGIIDRRTVLTKQPAEPMENPNQYWVKGTEEGLFRTADFSFAGAKFREPVAHATRRIHPEKTLAATLRRAGLFSPVYRRRRRHPEHLVLIDRASLPGPAANAAAPAISRDHLAAYGEALVGQFRAEQVITHVYYFNRDPRRCRDYESDSAAIDLAALESRHGTCRLLVLSDAAGLFEPLSGRPVDWLDEFARWPLRVVLTPKPVDEWGYPEGTLALNGFAVAPIHPRSLALLAELWLPLALREDSTEATLQQVRLLAPVESRITALPETLRHHGDRWLEPVSPDAGVLRALLSELRHCLGEDGFLLLQALAVYPEPSWPLTLYVDSVLNDAYINWKLVTPTGADDRRALRLLSLARLPWLRHGRMPDYLRLALVRSLTRARHRQVAAIYRNLQEAQEQQPHAIALNIAPPPKRGWFRPLLARKQPVPPLEDRIFAKVLLGGKPGWLDVELPNVLSRLLPAISWDEVAARMLAGFAAAALWAMLFLTVLTQYQTQFDEWLRNQELARHGLVPVKIIKAPSTDWQEGPLVDALTGGGFAPRIEDPPLGTPNPSGAVPNAQALMPSPNRGKNEAIPGLDTSAGSEKPLRPKLVWDGHNVIQAGSEAAAAGRWIAQRLRYIDYGREVLVNPDSLLADNAASSATAIAAPNEVTVWLADVPQAFQDSLAAPVFIEPDRRVIPAGQFTMGSPAQETGRTPDEGPQHTVKVAQFALGSTEVTFDEYDAFAKATNRQLPSDEGWGRGRRPVINVSWDDAQAYAAWLSEKAHKAYRLPTEAEWEYAARAKTQTSRYWGDDPKNQQACQYANVYDRQHVDEIKKRYSWAGTPFDCDDAYPFTAPVGQFKPNAWGLQDMLGNAWEWVADCWHDSYQGAPNDGSDWEDKKGCDSGRRVLRGGSWNSYPGIVRAAYRGRSYPGSGDIFIGFRLARTL